jgi:hypothetical protein
MTEWEQYSSSTWGKSSVASPVPFNPDTKYVRDFQLDAASPVVKLQERWDLSFGT